VQKAIVRLTSPFHTKEHTCIGCEVKINGMGWDVVDTQDEDNVICPLCGEEHGYYADMADCDGETLECEHCGKNFKLAVEAKLEFTTTTDCELNEGKHDWKESTTITGGQTIFYNCTICDAVKQEPRS